MSAATELLGTLGRRFVAEREALAEEMTERIRAEVAEFGDFAGPELWEAVRVSCLANLETGLTAMAEDRALPEAIPADARDLALLTARVDLPLAALLRAYRVGHAMTWRLWLEAVEGAAPDPETRRETLAAVSDYLFAYVDRLATFLTDEYTAERDRFMRSREQRRTQLVRDVLDGADPDPARSLGELDYDLRLEHLALVVAAENPEAAVRELGRRLDAPHRLVVSLAGDTAWAWLGRTRPFELPERLEPLAGATISIGEPGPGTFGFRRSHREARDAHGVALRTRERALVRYDEVALESLVTGDAGRSRAFVERELHGIDGDDARSRRLRETLRAYFACSQNASAAAAMLGVHEHTVTYRLRTVEERLGRPVNSRRAELEIALRLLEVE
ncbi:MAG TPA: helix-turn-helix domain-containing protein [Solirubrobacterales bacterium]|nr:helix-turn-helix domain-containing protein [Solirubrobacterales bacterium]